MQSRREFTKSIGLAAAAMATGLAAGEKPNIVYILSDDLGWGDLACYNPDTQVPMPSAAKLATESMRFNDMHSPSAVCTPTRYGILTGRYCWRTRLKSGVLNGYSPNLIDTNRLTVAKLLQQQGYATGCVGKWHLGLGAEEKTDFSKPLHPSPNDHGFDYFFGIPASLDMPPYLWVENSKGTELPSAGTPGKNEPRGVFWREGAIAPNFTIEGTLPTITAKAIDFVRTRARGAKPFFLYLPLTGPHTPWVPLKQFQGKSKAGIYGDFVVQVDDALGQMMQAVEQAGVAKNTLFIFTSDNGAHWTPQDKEKFPKHRANGLWRGQKADIQDAGHRIPFLVRWPGRVKPNSVSNEICCLTDLMATVAEVTGVALPRDAGEDSFSLLPAMKGGKTERPAVVHHSSQGLFAIRQGDWKLIVGRGSGGFTNPQKIEPKPGEPAGELYNLTKDPTEADNLYLKNPDVVKRLNDLLEKYKADGRSRG